MYAHAYGNAKRVRIWVVPLYVQGFSSVRSCSVPKKGEGMGLKSPDRSPDRAEPEYTLRILRIAAKQRLTLRTISPHYGGLYTHWYKGRSHYCPGREECQLHRSDVVWKGYAAVETWDQTQALWFPWVLEITEGLELDFRGRWDRGQVWEVWRIEDNRKRDTTPIRGKLLEERNPDDFPPAYDLRPQLMHVYHVRELRLDQLNPLPPRQLVKPNPGAPPIRPDQQRPEDRPMTAEELRAMRERLKFPKPPEPPPEPFDGPK